MIGINYLFAEPIRRRELPDGRLEYVQGGNVVGLFGGLLFLGSGLFLTGGGICGVGDLFRSPLPLKDSLLAIVVYGLILFCGLGFLLAGLWQIFDRTGVTLDHQSGTVTTWQSVLWRLKWKDRSLFSGHRISKEYFVADYTHVTAECTGGDQMAGYKYSALLIGKAEPLPSPQAPGATKSNALPTKRQNFWGCQD